METIHQVPIVVDAPEDDKKWAFSDKENTLEWAIGYSPFMKDGFVSSFIVHAKTKEDAFEHFKTLKPKMYVRRLEFYGIYFNL